MHVVLLLHRAVRRLTGSPRSASSCMPLYVASMQHVPPTMAESGALRLGRDVKAGLHAMHKAGWAHNDVKASNILLDDNGCAHMGDYGAAKPLGEESHERTLRVMPHDLESDILGADIYTSSAAFDHLLLAVTLLEWLGHLKTPCTCADVKGAAGKISDPELLQFVTDLLPAAQRPAV